MCLGVPGRVISVDGTDALVDFFGERGHTRAIVFFKRPLRFWHPSCRLEFRR